MQTHKYILRLRYHITYYSSNAHFFGFCWHQCNFSMEWCCSGHYATSSSWNVILLWCFLMAVTTDIGWGELDLIPRPAIAVWRYPGQTTSPQSAQPSPGDDGTDFIWPPKNFCQASLAVCSLSCCKICIEKEQHLTHLPKTGWKAFIPVIEPGDQRGTNFQEAALNRGVYGSAPHTGKSQRRCLFTSFHERTSPSCPCQLFSCQLMLSPQVFPPEPVNRSHSTTETCRPVFPQVGKVLRLTQRC